MMEIKCPGQTGTIKLTAIEKTEIDLIFFEAALIIPPYFVDNF